MAKKEPNRTRNKNIHLAFTEEEYENFKRKKERLKYNNYTDFVIRAVSNVPIYTFDTLPLLKALTEVSRVGNNVNQIAKVANETGNIYENDVRDLQEKIKIINNLISSALSVMMSLKENDILKKIET